METTHRTRAKATPGRALNITLWIVQILLGGMFVFAGGTKLFGHQPEMIQAFDKIGLGQWFRYFTGALELAGGLGLFLPRLSGLAALDLVCVMVGAVVTHALVLPPVSMAAMPGTLAVVFALIAWARRSHVQAIVEHFSSMAGHPASYADHT
jgi:uncharacterized membrane protein YphA (DoxX/SURF4 family)